MRASIYVFAKTIFRVEGLRAVNRVRLGWGNFWDRVNMMGGLHLH